MRDNPFRRWAGYAVVTVMVLASVGVWVTALTVARSDTTPDVVVGGPLGGPSADAVEKEPRGRRVQGEKELRRRRVDTQQSTRRAGALWLVSSVVDGDTLVVASAEGTEEHLRVIGIDTPERGSCGYDEASAALAAMVANRMVELSSGAADDRDHYGRILRYVDVDGADAGLAMIQKGLAVARYDSRDGYGYHPRQDGYVAADESTPDIC
ncbi:MAG: hypothetical protein GEU74_07225 [Nitriliruptorales bacterium]|nr:hypothetical protein [Nitriliruptorales bacterium]